MRLATRRAAAVTFLAITGPLVLASCGGPPDARPRGERVSARTPAPSERQEAFAILSGATPRQVDIGRGDTLHLECAGEGEPTVLLESGDESGVSQWSPVFPALAAHTRTCAYDRAGVGQSSAARGCRRLPDILRDTETLLERAGVRPPYLLVGTSGGGFLMAGLAARDPQDVAGLVLLETPRASRDVPRSIRQQIRCDAPNNIEHRDYLNVENAAWDARRRIGTFPMTIMSNDWGSEVPPGESATNARDQRGWLVLSPNSKQVVVDSGHDVVFHETTLVVETVLDTLRLAR